MKFDPVFQVAILCLLVFLAEVLARWPGFRHVGSAMLVIGLGALVMNLGYLPTPGEGSPVYDAVFSQVVQLAIFWLLLGVNLLRVIEVGGRTLGLFLIGALGTFLGVFVGMRFVGGEAAFGPNFAAFGGMFAGTYTGGSVNFNAIAAQYQIPEKEQTLFVGATAVDNVMTAIWMVATLGLPRLMGALRSGEGSLDTGPIDSEGDAEHVHPRHLALLFALGAGALVASDQLAAWVLVRWEVSIPPILILTTLALLLAPIPAIRDLPGPRLLGMFAVQVFLCVIGALCDVEAFREIGELGPRLFAFVAVIMAVHGIVLLIGGKLLKADPESIAVASQANIGGGTTALAIARSLGRKDLVVPAIVAGSLGTALGNYLGVLMVSVLG